MLSNLSHLKVVEIASVLAGPSVGMFFAELGASVLKVENKKTGGDVTRSWKLPNEDKEAPISAYYCSVNWNKESILLDFKDPESFQLLLKHIETADLLIANFKKGDAEKFGLDYHKMKVLNSNLIYGEITGFGPDSDRVAYDLILQAESGFMSMNGTPDSGSVKMPVALIDVLAGHQLRAGMLLALYERDAQNKGGAHVQVSLYDAAVGALANQATNWLMAEHIPVRMGSQHPNIAPYGELFQTKDGKTITFAIGSDRQFKNLCKTLEAPSVAEDQRFSSNANRVTNRTALKEILESQVMKFEKDNLLETLHGLFVPVAEIKDLKAVFETPAALELVLEEKREGVFTKRVKSTVFRIER
ncbi:MAG: CaiB/BaiF CoA transferase family protein [Crocinitomicaceae bacterium]